MKFAKFARGALASAALVGLAACSTMPSQPGELIADPYVETNRDIHAFNKGVDTALVRPASQVYDFVTPTLVKHLISNGVDHLKLPGVFVNRVLQGDARNAGRVLARFLLNTTIGAGGLLDPATEFGVPNEPTDFGVTLAEWGAEEGDYHELPLLGPSTTRHAVGRVVDFALDPSTLITVGAVEVGTAITVIDASRTPLDIVNTRHENAELIDDVLYESEDSYVTTRTGYVQARRRFVSGETDTDQLPDLFEE
ncbi:MAG: VacJ family lipoprotein [Pseudomonadota bacterium]